MSFADKGAVADIEPAFFIGYLHRLKATGTLKFEEASIQRAIYFREGRVLFSSSNAPEDQLGAILIAGGKISQEQFDGLLAGLEPKQSIAAALAQGGHVSQRDIGDAARRKVEQIVGSCCVQTSGRYEFDRVRYRVSGPQFRSADLAHWLALDVASQALADAGFEHASGTTPSRLRR